MTDKEQENPENKHDAKHQVDGLVTLEEAFEAAAEAAEYLGDILNNMDAGTREDYIYTAPLFDKIHSYQNQTKG